MHSKILDDILPPNFSTKKINTSRKKLTSFYLLVKVRATIENYLLLFQESLKIITNHDFKYLFTKSYKDYISKRFEGVDIKPFELILNSVKKPKVKRRRLWKKKSKNDNTKKPDNKVVSKIYNNREHLFKISK